MEAEKPNPAIFEAAFDALGVRPAEAVHVGDDRRQDSVNMSCCLGAMLMFDV